MNTKKTRPRRVAVEPKPFDQARDELFQHIMRCEVVGSHPDHQKEWFDETLASTPTNAETTRFSVKAPHTLMYVTRNGPQAPRSPEDARSEAEWIKPRLRPWR